MLKLEKPKGQYIEYVDSLFRYLYLLLVFMTFCSFTAGTPMVSKFAWIVVVFSSVVLLYKAIFFKSFWKDPYHFLLGLFILSHIFSSLMNAGYGLGSNIKATIWFILLFAGIASFDREISKDKIIDKVNKICYVFLGCNFMMLLGSMYYLVTVKGMFFYLDKAAQKANLVGMLWGRLWGIFTDPNYGGVIQVIAIVLSLYYLGSTNKKIFRILLYIQLVMAGLYYSYSNSRTAFVVAVVVAFVYTFFTYYCQWFKMIKVFLVYFCIIFTVGGIGPKVIHLYMNSGIYARIEHIEKDALQEKISAYEEAKSKRNQEIESDLSNRRFELWQSAVEIGKASPIWGVSTRNVVPFAKDRLPNTYMINNSMEVQFDSSHNVVLDIWMGQGVIGLSIFVIFVIKFLSDLWKLLQKGYIEKQVRVILTCIIGLMASGFFIPDLIYVNSIGAYLLWTFMGFIIYYFQVQKMKK